MLSARNSQSGFAHFVVIFLLLAGLAVGIFLVSRPTNLKPKADTLKPIVTRGYIIEFTDPPPTNRPDGGEPTPEEIKADQQPKINGILDTLNINPSSTSSGTSRPEADDSKEVILQQYTTALNAVAMDITADEVNSLKGAQLSYIKHIYPNLQGELALKESVPLIGANKLWVTPEKVGSSTYLTGKNTIIAILDTGVGGDNDDSSLPLSKKVLFGRNFAKDSTEPRDQGRDEHGHGTHVASIATENGSLEGVAREAKIVSFKVFDKSGAGYMADVIQGVQASMNTLIDSDPANNISVINISLSIDCKRYYGGYNQNCGPDDPLSKAVDNAVDRGIVVVVAAGNTGPGMGTITSPGTSRKAITVGSIDKKKVLASDSSKGPVSFTNGQGVKETLNKPDILAPGVGICAAEWGNYQSYARCFDGQHILKNGTSMSAPHIAGIAAILRQAYPDKTALQIKEMVLNNADNLNFDPNSQGKGMVNATKIFAQFIPGATPIPTPKPPSTKAPKPTKTPKTGISSIPTVTVEPISTNADLKIKISWSGLAGITATDWLGIFTPGDSDSAYKAKIYLNCSQTSPKKGRTTGFCLITPAALQPALTPGEYEVRIFVANGVVAKSSLFQIR